MPIIKTCVYCGDRMAWSDYGMYHAKCRKRVHADRARRAAEEELFAALRHAKELPDGGKELT